ncbi:MAG: hypothetical protein KA515_00480 [Candidatus Pacebacteria bacterium]|nr:hypothetical protein [Candidatus Paceibacterota bacterium]
MTARDIQNFWIAEYKRLGALWIHDGHPKRPHALLTSGLHSGGFFNSKIVVQDDILLNMAAKDLVSVFFDQACERRPYDIAGVIGPQTGATKLAQFLSLELPTKEPAISISPAKGEVDGQKAMIFTEEERAMIAGRKFLLCEDVLTTGLSVDLTAEAVKKAGGIVEPYMLVLVNRSGLREIAWRQVVALIDNHMPIWTPKECPLCPVSKAIRPKSEDGQNWALLNAKY